MLSRFVRIWKTNYNKIIIFLQGLSAGRCEVQAVSPVTGRVMGAREVRVASDRVAIAGLRANVVSGLQLRVSAASDSGNSKY